MQDFTFFYSNDLFSIIDINGNIVATVKSEKSARAKMADLERGLLHEGTKSAMAAAFRKMRLEK
jgi:hypothetical protein|tara:strand:- start:5 stop:196 length:192 start_codon:yes stop_codon:yes gene_type:complete